MPDSNNTAVWQISNPSTWPAAPQWMSFSTLSELEICPRRWALSAAEYPHIWKQHGYPRSPQQPLLEGTVVHLALERITAVLAERGCPSLQDESAFWTLKELGGYTAIIVDCMEDTLQSYKDNPRATPFLEEIHRRLAARIPELRSRVQRLLSRIHLETSTNTPLDITTSRIGEFRRQLSYGAHAEVELRVPEFAWLGKADLITCSKESCEIRDFKTGLPKQMHEFQILAYALLWARDRALNPAGRPADRLVLSYDEGDKDVPAPDDGALCELENELKRRTSAALVALRMIPPEVRPHRENCSYCGVRQLCEEYWQWQVRQVVGGESPEGQVTDLQIRLSARHGPTSWDGAVESSRFFCVGHSILLRTSVPVVDLHPGQSLRLMNAHVSILDDQKIGGQSHAAVATMWGSTEVFLVQR